MLENIGNRIKEAIENSGLTKSYIADQCSVSKQAITGWINKSSIDKTNLMKVSKLTQYSYEWLLTGKGEKLITKRGDRQVALNTPPPPPMPDEIRESGSQAMYIVSESKEVIFEIDQQRLVHALEIIKEDAAADWCQKPIVNQARIIMMAYDRAGKELKEK